MTFAEFPGMSLQIMGPEKRMDFLDPSRRTRFMEKLFDDDALVENYFEYELLMKE